MQAEEVTNQAFQAATPDPLRHDASPLVHMFNRERLEDVLRIGSLASQQVTIFHVCTVAWQSLLCFPTFAPFLLQSSMLPLRLLHCQVLTPHSQLAPRQQAARVSSPSGL